MAVCGRENTYESRIFWQNLWYRIENSSENAETHFEKRTKFLGDVLHFRSINYFLAKNGFRQNCQIRTSYDEASIFDWNLVSKCLPTLTVLLFWDEVDLEDKGLSEPFHSHFDFTSPKNPKMFFEHELKNERRSSSLSSLFSPLSRKKKRRWIIKSV